MKKSLLTFLTASVLVFSCVFTSSIFAANTSNATTKPDPVLESSATPMIARLANKLELTDAQRTQIRTIVQNAEVQAMAVNDSMQKNRTILTDMLNNNIYDEKKIANLAEQQGKSVAKIIEIQAKMQHDIVQVLTPEQRTELKQTIADAQKRLDDLRAAAANAQAKQAAGE